MDKNFKKSGMNCYRRRHFSNPSTIKRLKWRIDQKTKQDMDSMLLAISYTLRPTQLVRVVWPLDILYIHTNDTDFVTDHRTFSILCICVLCKGNVASTTLCSVSFPTLGSECAYTSTPCAALSSLHQYGRRQT